MCSIWFTLLSFAEPWSILLGHYKSVAAVLAKGFFREKLRCFVEFCSTDCLVPKVFFFYCLFIIWFFFEQCCLLYFLFSKKSVVEVLLVFKNRYRRLQLFEYFLAVQEMVWRRQVSKIGGFWIHLDGFCSVSMR